MRADKAAEGEAAQRQRQRGGLRRPRGLLAHPRGYGQQVVLLGDAVVMLAGGRADAAEVGAHGGIAQLHEGARQRLRDLVVLGAAEQRMRVGNQRQAARLALRQVHRNVDRADGAGNGKYLGMRVHRAVRIAMNLLALARKSRGKK
ncbi:hypothetical protein D9M68_790180 [compost metagenome]